MTVTISASKFKAGCLQYLDDVAAGGGEVIVTKHGRPVARLVPIASSTASLRGSVLASDDEVMAPIEEGWFTE